MSVPVWVRLVVTAIEVNKDIGPGDVVSVGVIRGTARDSVLARPQVGGPCRVHVVVLLVYVPHLPAADIIREAVGYSAAV